MDKKRMTQLVNSTTSSSLITSLGITSVISVESLAPQSSALIEVRSDVQPLSTSRVPTHHAKQLFCQTQTFTVNNAYRRRLKPSQASLSNSRTIRSVELSQCVIQSLSARQPFRIRSGSRARLSKVQLPQECPSSIRPREVLHLRMHSRSTLIRKVALRVEGKPSRTQRTWSTASSRKINRTVRMKE